MKTAKVLLKDLSITELKSQYDLNARYLLANKNILARILAGCVREFSTMTPEEIIPFIGDDIHIGSVRTEPGMTNGRIRGIQREDYTPEEGRIFFDLLFTVNLPDRENIRIFVNIEMENSHFPQQALLSRSIYYPVRELSSQGGRNFSLTRQEYDRLRKVYSIWILMNVPEYMADTIKTIRLQDHTIYGNDYVLPGSYDLMETILIGVGKKESDISGLPDLLHVLLANTLGRKRRKRYWKKNTG